MNIINYMTGGEDEKVEQNEKRRRKNLLLSPCTHI